MTKTAIVMFTVLMVWASASWAILPRNIIFVIGDGMGPEHIKAADYYLSGAEGSLSFESFPHETFICTYPAGYGIPDSASGGTAYATGQKVYGGVVSVAYPGDRSDLPTVLEYYHGLGYSAGLVSNLFMTSVPPAAFAAHVVNRDDYAGIADDMLFHSRPEVLFGGGGYGMSAALAQQAGYAVVTNRSQMLALDPATVTRVSGQFGTGYMPFEYYGLPSSYPHLSEMTSTAINILQQNTNGFFLMVEAGLIDTAAHANALPVMIPEMLELNHTVQTIMNWAQGRTDTLVIVTADHETGGLAVLNNNGAGNYPDVSWGTHNHTDSAVKAFGWGVNSPMITGYYMDNVMLYDVMRAQHYSADANHDGFINIDDYGVWADQYGQTGSGLDADFNCDSVVDGGDYSVWADQTEPQVPQVPEPATAALLLGLLTAAIRGRMRRRE